METVTGEVLNINNEYRSYQEYKAAVDDELQKSAESFVRIGYLLKVARDTDILKESGYGSVNEFAQAEYGLDKSQVSRFIRINDEYSEEGYSDRLQDKYREFGYAKLSIMLLLPAAINDELSANYSKSEIQAIKEEVEEEKKISDLEVMMEEKNQDQEEMDIFTKVLHQLCREQPELYLKLHDAVENTVYNGSNAPVISKMVEALAPAGEHIYTVRIAGEGKKLLSVKGSNADPVVVDMRSEESQSCSWNDFIIDMEILSEHSNAKESWEKLYGEPFPEQKKSEIAPVQQKKPSKVTRTQPEKPKEKEYADENRQESSPDHGSDSSRTEEGSMSADKSGCADVSDGNEKENGSDTVVEEELPGQMQLEKDFPEYCPEERKIAPVQPEIPAHLVKSTTEAYLEKLKDTLEMVNRHAEQKNYAKAVLCLERAREEIDKLRQLLEVEEE